MLDGWFSKLDSYQLENDFAKRRHHTGECGRDQRFAKLTGAKETSKVTIRSLDHIVQQNFFYSTGILVVRRTPVKCLAGCLPAVDLRSKR